MTSVRPKKRSNQKSGWKVWLCDCCLSCSFPKHQAWFCRQWRLQLQHPEEHYITALPSTMTLTRSGTHSTGAGKLFRAKGDGLPSSTARRERQEIRSLHNAVIVTPRLPGLPFAPGGVLRWSRLVVIEGGLRKTAALRPPIKRCKLTSPSPLNRAFILAFPEGTSALFTPFLLSKPNCTYVAYSDTSSRFSIPSNSCTSLTKTYTNCVCTCCDAGQILGPLKTAHTPRSSALWWLRPSARAKIRQRRRSRGQGRVGGSSWSAG